MSRAARFLFLVLLTCVLAALLLDAHVPPYRRAEWRHWTGACLDTRERVLVEEAVSVRLAAGGCAVAAGNWVDPYGGEAVTNPRQLDVDHVVPLGWAHAHGGWAWDRARKQAFANDREDPDHLVAVAASLNRQKGDKGPDRWVPPRAAVHCWYGQAWDRIVRRWGLALTAEEWDAIRRLTDTCVPQGE